MSAEEIKFEFYACKLYVETVHVGAAAVKFDGRLQPLKVSAQEIKMDENTCKLDVYAVDLHVEAVKLNAKAGLTVHKNHRVR